MEDWIDYVFSMKEDADLVYMHLDDEPDVKWALYKKNSCAYRSSFCMGIYYDEEVRKCHHSI